MKEKWGNNDTYYIDEHFELEDTTPVKYVFAGNLRAARATPTETVYFHKDHLGSSSAMSNAAGVAIETSNYLPFGGMRAHSGIWTSDYKFTDQEFDGESGLYNYNARLYDPVIGRFISADSIIPEPYDPQLLNRYSYVRNNPLIYVDPSGHRLGNGYDYDEHDFDDNPGNIDEGGGNSGGGEGGNKNSIDNITHPNTPADYYHLDDVVVTAEKWPEPGFNGPENNTTSSGLVRAEGIAKVAIGLTSLTACYFFGVINPVPYQASIGLAAVGIIESISGKTAPDFFEHAMEAFRGMGKQLIGND